MFQGRFRVLSCRKVSQHYCNMILDSPESAARPGQFVHVLCGDERALLRRPLSVHWQEKGTVELLFHVRGPGTLALSRKKSGQKLDVIGFLGRGYRIPPGHAGSGAHEMLVGGGVGVASLLFLAKTLRDRGHAVSVLIGARTRKQVLSVDRFKRLGCKVEIATDDGSSGYRGLVTGLLEKKLTMRRIPDRIYACGPKPMLKEVAEMSRKHKVPCQLSMEEHMACGVGACRGCAVKIKNSKLKINTEQSRSIQNRSVSGYKLACKDGPVFDAEEIIWEKT